MILICLSGAAIKSHPLFPIRVHTSHNFAHFPSGLLKIPVHMEETLAGQEYVDGFLVATTFVSATIFFIYLIPINRPSFELELFGDMGLADRVFSLLFPHQPFLDIVHTHLHVLGILCIQHYASLGDDRARRTTISEKGRETETKEPCKYQSPYRMFHRQQSTANQPNLTLFHSQAF
jgi:hypothetical protein